MNIQPPSDPRTGLAGAGLVQAAEARSDYRFFRFVALYSAKLTMAGLFFLGWYMAAYALWKKPISVGIFLLTTTAWMLIASLAASLVAYSLFKRRGGRIVKSERPSET